MTYYSLLLLLTTFLCCLVAGLLFAFAIVVMPGIGRLDDRDFLRAFQVIDRVIQNNQPAFLLVWVGSVLALVAAAVLGIGTLSGANRLLVLAATLVYVLGVQVPTVTINIPLNNELQKLDTGKLDDTEGGRARSAFEPRWNRWNEIRTAFSILTSLLLLFVVLRM
jgi:uncharacterized membrane protein